MIKYIHVIVICLILTIIACDLKEPDVINYEPTCQIFLKCLYLNQDNPDKTICSALADGCKSANDFNACLNPALKENRMDFKDCLLLMRK